MKNLIYVLLATILLISCNKDNDDPKDITLTGGTSTSIKVYADEVAKTDGIKFNALSQWRATVADVSARAGGNVEWLTLSAYEGKAGEQSITLTLLTNTTGVDRRAEIRITCANTTITITVEQKGVTQSGEKPDPRITFITPEGKITGGRIYSNNLPTSLRWAMRSNSAELLSTTAFPYINDNFDITLPVPAANLLGELTDNPGLTVIPSNAKFTTAVLYDQNNVVELTNIALANINNNSYKLKAGEGYVYLIYATVATTVSGTFTDGSDGFQHTFKFNSCSFRQGWNEMVMIAESDETSNGSVTFRITTNNALSSFKWVVNNGNEPVFYYEFQTSLKRIDDEPIVTIEWETTYQTGAPSHYDNLYKGTIAIDRNRKEGLDYAVYNNKGNGITETNTSLLYLKSGYVYSDFLNTKKRYVPMTYSNYLFEYHGKIAMSIADVTRLIEDANRCQQWEKQGNTIIGTFTNPHNGYYSEFVAVFEDNTHQRLLSVSKNDYNTPSTSAIETKKLTFNYDQLVKLPSGYFLSDFAIAQQYKVTVHYENKGTQVFYTDAQLPNNSSPFGYYSAGHNVDPMNMSQVANRIYNQNGTISYYYDSAYTQQVLGEGLKPIDINHDTTLYAKWLSR